jgi:hypothetical protein
MLASESLNLSALVSINGVNGNSVPLLRLTASINNNFYNVQMQVLDKTELENNQTYVNQEVTAFKSLVEQRVIELGGNYLG